MDAPIGRRAVLTGGGAVCALVLLGACGDAEPAGGDAEPAGSEAEPEGSEAAPASSTGANPPGFLANVADVPVGGGKLAAGTVLLVQPTTGTIKAWDARCPHQGTILPAPDGSGVITCPSHLTRFKGEDGALIDGLATTGLRPISINIADGRITRA